jgi:hypothetical protein
MTTTDDVTILTVSYSFAGPFGDHMKGDRVRSDHPSVALLPDAFHDPMTTASDEIKTGFETLDRLRHEREIERIEEELAEYRAQAESNPVRIEGPRLMRCTKDHHGYYEGRPARILKGSVVPSDDPAVEGAPNYWKRA